jgi:hypothetical protein
MVPAQAAEGIVCAQAATTITSTQAETTLKAIALDRSPRDGLA